MSAILSTYRALTRHKLFAALNIGGLALGIAVFLVLYLFVQFETGYDRTLPGWDKVWVVDRTMDIPNSPAFKIPSRSDMLPQLQSDDPSTIGARFSSDDVAVPTGTTATTEKLAFVDPAFFRLFPYPALIGDPRAALARPDAAVVTRRIADTYFGSPGKAMGRALTVTHDGKPATYAIAAVIENLPSETTYPNDIFVAFPPGDAAGRTARGTTTFLRFATPPTEAEGHALLALFTKRHPEPSPPPTIDRLIPLGSIHLTEPADRAIVGVLGLVGLLALGVAIVNYINLATARAGLRAREVAVRKVVGGSRRAIVAQFLGEAFAAVALATLIGIALVEVALPFVNANSGTTLSLHYLGSRSILLPAILLILGVGVIAGSYPAFVLSRFQPAAVLASNRTPGGTRGGARARRLLVIGQFGVAIALMIGTAVLVAQLRHVRNSDIGFDRHGLMMVTSFAAPALDDAQRAAIQREIAALPDVDRVVLSAPVPGGGSFSIGPMHRAGATGKDPMITQNAVGPGFFEGYRARLIAGRTLDAARFRLDDNAVTESKADQLTASKRPVNIILNRAAVGRLGFASPAAAIGQVLTRGESGGPMTVVGVIEDMRFGSPHDRVEPQGCFLYTAGLNSPVLSARIAEGRSRAVEDAISTIWQRIAPAVPLVSGTADAALYGSYYRKDAQRAWLFTIGAMLAVVIGCLGLYGLAAFDTARRVREIGIRKTLGASTRDVLRLLVGQFARPVLIANLIAWPIAYVAMRRWLGGFDDRIALSPWFFVGASVAALVIAVLTVIGQAWRVARAAPAIALRHA